MNSENKLVSWDYHMNISSDEAMNGCERDIEMDGVTYTIQIPKGIRNKQKRLFNLGRRDVIVDFSVVAILNIDYWNNKKGYEATVDYLGRQYNYRLKRPIPPGGEQIFIKTARDESFCVILGVYPKALSGKRPEGWLSMTIKALIAIGFLFFICAYCSEVADRNAEKKIISKYHLESTESRDIRYYKGTYINWENKKETKFSLLLVIADGSRILGELTNFSESNKPFKDGEIKGSKKGNTISFKDAAHVQWTGTMVENMIDGTYVTPKGEGGKWNARWDR